MAPNQYAKTERDFSSILNSANMSPADRDKLSAILASLVGFQSTQPGTNESIEEQIAGVQAEIGDILAAISNIKAPVWKMQEFNSSGTFTVPSSIAGSVLYVTGCGGGASGASCVTQPATVGLSESGNAGCFSLRVPVQALAGESVTVTIGSGGAPAVSVAASGANVFTAANAGGSSFFGSLEFCGGDALPIAGGGWRSGYFLNSAINQTAENSIRYKAGKRVQSGNAVAFGSAAGAYGNGCDGVAVVGATSSGISAAENSGAAGGSVSVTNNTAGSLTATSGAGGKGKIIVEWQEFV